MDSTDAELSLHRPASRRSGPGSDSGSARSGLEAGAELAEFRLLRLIARGGQGEVWEAEQRSLGRRVALKVLRADGLDERVRGYFDREARAAGRVSHPAVVAVHGSGTEGALCWLALELVEGECTLADFLEDVRGRAEVPKGYYPAVTAFFAALAEGVEFAHAAGVVHRDLKPRNVLVTPDDEPKVTDFGLARLVDEASLSSAGDLVGTYFYMSPEQVTGRLAGLDHRTDVFSFGVMLYEALTLVRPFEGDSVQQISSKILFVDPPDPRNLRSRVPGELAVVCMKALEKNPDQRYATMGELAAELRRILAHEPIRTRPPGLVRRAEKWVRRNPTRAAILVLGSVSFAVVLYLMLVARDALELSEDRLEQRDVALANERRVSYVANLTLADQALEQANLPEARRRLEAAAEEHRGWEWDHLTRAAEGSLASFPLASVGEGALALHPDGERFVFGDRSGRVALCSLADGSVLREYVGHERIVLAAAFRPDGRVLATAGSAPRDQEGRPILLWDVESGEELGRLFGHERAVVDLAWNAEGTELASRSSTRATRFWRLAEPVSDTVSTPGPNAVEDLASRPGASSWVLAKFTEKPRSILRELALTEERELRTLRPDRALIGAGGTEALFTAVAVDPAGELCAASRGDGEEHGAHTVELFELRGGGHLASLGGPRARITDVAFSADGELVAATDWDGALWIWDVEDEELRARHRGHEGPALHVVWTPDSESVLTRGWDGSVRVWRGSTRDRLATDPVYFGTALFADGGSSLCFLEDGGAVLSRLELGSGRVEPVDVELVAGASSLATGGKGERFLARGVDGSVHYLDLAKGRTEAVLPNEAPHGYAVAVRPDEGQGAFAEGKRLYVQDLPPTSEPRVLHEQELRVHALAYDPRGRRIAAIDAQGNLTLLDSGSGAVLLHVPMTHVNGVRALSFSPDGTRIATAGEDSALRIWSLADGRELLAYEGHPDRVRAVAWHPDGTRIASGDFSRDVRVWHADTGDTLAVLRGHAGEVYWLTWSPDGRTLVSSSKADGYRLWRTDR